MDDAQQAGVGFHRGKFKLGDEAVDLVEDEAGGELFDPGLAENGVGLDVNTFNGINKNESAVRKASGGGNLAAKVHVTGGIDEVDGVVTEEERDGRTLHSDSAALLLV